MDNIKRCLKFVFENEGGYSNHTHDKGGETMMGITAGTLARAYKAGLVSCDDVKALTRQDAEEIYRCFYWEPSKAPSMPWPLCAVHFDAAVNHGVGGAGKLLQKALNDLCGAGLDVDGAVGPLTQRALLDALDAKGATAVCLAYLDKREALFKWLAAKDSTQAEFLKGWLNRIKHNRRLVADSE